MANVFDGLIEPASWYFDVCRRILWRRLSYDKLFELYNDTARLALARIWAGALAKSLGFPDGNGEILNPRGFLNEALQGDDDTWRKLVSTVEAVVDMRRVVDDYFLGVDEKVVADALRDGSYDV